MYLNIPTNSLNLFSFINSPVSASSITYHQQRYSGIILNFSFLVLCSAKRSSFSVIGLNEQSCSQSPTQCAIYDIRDNPNTSTASMCNSLDADGKYPHEEFMNGFPCL